MFQSLPFRLLIGLSYDGTVTQQFPAFIQIIIIVLIGHYVWMAVLYGVASIFCMAINLHMPTNMESKKTKTNEKIGIA